MGRPASKSSLNANSLALPRGRLATQLHDLNGLGRLGSPCKQITIRFLGQRPSHFDGVASALEGGSTLYRGDQATFVPKAAPKRRGVNVYRMQSTPAHDRDAAGNPAPS